MESNYPLGNWRSLAAVLLSAALIVGAYILARGIEAPATAQASSEKELLEAIAAKDSDGDGLADWEEALYGTDPKKQDSLNLGMTDGAAVAKGLVVPKAATPGVASITRSSIDPSLPVPAEGTITRALSENLITAYAKAIQTSPNGELSPADIKRLSNEILTQLDQSLVLAPDFRSRESIKISGSGAEAMRSYAAAAEAVFTVNKVNVSNTDLTYLKKALEDDDQDAIKRIGFIAQMYRDTAAGLAVLPVPNELVDIHLQLVNSMARMGNIDTDLTRVNADPIVAMFALRQYPDAIQDLGKTFIKLNAAYKTAAIVLVPGEPGTALVTLIERVAARQKAKGTP